MEMTTGQAVQFSMIGILWLLNLWELYLKIRQYRVCGKTTEVPGPLKDMMTSELLENSRRYLSDGLCTAIVEDFYNVIVYTLVLYYGGLYELWTLSGRILNTDNEIAQSCTWVVLMCLFSTFISLPFTVYKNFVVEQKYGFNKQTAGFFIKDQIKYFILLEVLVLPITAFAVYIVDVGGDYFFVWLWLMVSAVLMVYLILYNPVIAPLFDKFTPLPPGELRTSIEGLASKLEFPLKELYVVEGSKRSSHSNAYYFGIFKSKRIVLFDTLLFKDGKVRYETDEICGVLSHELGHWKHDHLVKNVFVMEIHLLIAFATFGLMIKFKPLFEAMGCPEDVMPTIIGLIGVLTFVLAPYNIISNFIQCTISRHFEFQADKFASSLGRAEPLKSALIKLHNDNLQFPVYDPIFAMWHFSHPTLLERLHALSDTDKKSM